MLSKQTVQVRWSSNNKNHYENKGYIYTKIGDIFDCKAEDLSPNSDYKIYVRCDYCGEIFYPMFKKYRKHREILAKDACKKCCGKKCKDVKLIKYGSCSPIIFYDWKISAFNKSWMENVLEGKSLV